MDSASIQIKFRQIFSIKCCTKYNWNFGGFLKIHIIFFEHNSNVNNWNNAQINYLLTELLLNLLAVFFIEKTRFLSKFFWNSEFGMRVYREKIKAWNEDTFLYTFLAISPRKINILKRAKLHPTELNKRYDMNFEKNTVHYNECFKIYYKNVKKMKKK